jgi:hypothetical protein
MRTFIFRTSDLVKARKDEDFCIADVDFKNDMKPENFAKTGVTQIVSLA